MNQNWKKFIQPTKGKIIFVIIYAVLFILFETLSVATDVPDRTGFPFTFKITGCYFKGDCVNEFYPLFLLLNVLIPIGIYLGIGIIGSATNKFRTKQ